VARADDEDQAPLSAAAPIEVLREERRFVAVAKPSGVAVHHGWSHDGEVALALTRDALGRYVFPVHRLDRPTSGVLLFALDAEGARTLHEMFEDGRMDKRYLALVRGVMPEQGTIDHPIPRREDGPRVPAVTSFQRLWAGDHISLVEARPHTGRLHQVRRHLKHLSHPVIGDANYGKGALNRAYREQSGLARLALHAAKLSFVDPWTGEPVTIEAPLPDDLRAPLSRIGVPAALLS
jgi:tRNA pseudouridine65 synthase